MMEKIFPFDICHDFFFQQVVDANVDYNAREGRSTAEVSVFFMHLLIGL